MSAAATTGGRRRKKHHEEHEEHIDERWLLTYADMITLLMALFIVLFSISSVNKSEYEVLQRTLSDAFSGKVFPGGKGIKEAGGSDANATSVGSSPNAASIRPNEEGGPGNQAVKAEAEQKQFERLKAAVDAAIRDKGMDGKVRAKVSDRGLEVRLLTDDLLFDSGSAVPKVAGADLLLDIGQILKVDKDHPVLVEGHTDDVPIASAQFPTNWELSAARATGVVRVLAGGGITPKRLTAQGRADLDAIASNGTLGGRAMNRRVEILLPRQVASIGASTRTSAPTRSADGAETGPASAVEAAVSEEFPSIRPDVPTEGHP